MKKSVLFLISLMFCIIFAFTASALDLNQATIVNVGAPVTSEILEIDPEDTFLFELKEAGTVNISINSNVPYFTTPLQVKSGEKMQSATAMYITSP